jgi:hypothetical protein
VSSSIFHMERHFIYFPLGSTGLREDQSSGRHLLGDRDILNLLVWIPMAAAVTLKVRLTPSV